LHKFFIFSPLHFSFDSTFSSFFIHSNFHPITISFLESINPLLSFTHFHYIFVHSSSVPSLFSSLTKISQFLSLPHFNLIFIHSIFIHSIFSLLFSSIL
jgi:hypothetical protein